MSELKSTALGYEATTDDNERLQITELSMDSNFALEVGVGDAARILNDIAGEVDEDLLADALKYLDEHHVGEEQWFDADDGGVPEDERPSFGELAEWADKNGIDLR